MSFLLNPIMKWVVGLIVDAFDGIFTTVKSLLTSTPDVTVLPQVQTLTGRSTSLVDAVFVLAFVAAGVLTMTAGSSEPARYTAKQLLPRMVVAFVAAHFSTLVASRLIDLVDAAATSLGGDRPDRLGAFTAISTELDDRGAGIAPLLFAVLAAIITFLFAAVAFSYLGRFAVLILLTAAAPLALACHALPQTDGAARMWWRALFGCLAIPLAQTVTLQAGETILLDPHTMATLFGAPASGVLQLLIVIALLWVTVKIPGMVRRYVLRSPGSSIGTHLIRVLVVGTGARIVGGTPAHHGAARVVRTIAAGAR
jgi:hypothetical protein